MFNVRFTFLEPIDSLGISSMQRMRQIIILWIYTPQNHLVDVPVGGLVVDDVTGRRIARFATTGRIKLTARGSHQGQ